MNIEKTKHSDSGAICAIGDGQGGEFYVSLKILLQCLSHRPRLQLAEMNATIPPVPQNWKEQNIAKDWIVTREVRQS